MLKLNASYSKKVPAEGEYSSQSYHASIEVELPDGLSQEQLNSKIHETFALVRDSVEKELHGNSNANRAAAPVHGKKAASSQDGPASPKQIKFLLDLARTAGLTPQQLAARFRVNSVEELSRTACSRAIDELAGRAA